MRGIFNFGQKIAHALLLSLTLLSLMKMQGAELLKPYCRIGEHGPQFCTLTAHTLPGCAGIL